MRALPGCATIGGCLNRSEPGSGLSTGPGTGQNVGPWTCRRVPTLGTSGGSPEPWDPCRRPPCHPPPWMECAHPRGEDPVYPSGLESSYKDKPKAPSYGSQKRSLGGEELSRASREWLSCGSHRLLGGGGPHTHTTRCHQAGKASWQWAHPGWAAAPSAAPKLLIMGEIEKNKTRCFLEHFWHS